MLMDSTYILSAKCTRTFINMSIQTKCQRKNCRKFIYSTLNRRCKYSKHYTYLLFQGPHNIKVLVSEPQWQLTLDRPKIHLGPKHQQKIQIFQMESMAILRFVSSIVFTYYKVL